MMYLWPTTAGRGGVAVEAARAAQAQYEVEKLALFYRVKKAYYEYYYLARSHDAQ